MNTQNTSATQKITVTGVLLAGGKSSRLGQDKALLNMSGADKPNLLTQLIKILHSVCPRVIVSGREHPHYDYCLDTAPDKGPLAGIISALELSGTACLVISCDLPFLDQKLLSQLLEARNRRPAGTWLTACKHMQGSKTEWLIAVYEPESLPWLKSRLEQNHLRLKEAIPENKRFFLELSPEQALPCFNINKPEDLKKAKQILAAKFLQKL